MRRFITALVSALLLSLPSWADPGAGRWTTVSTGWRYTFTGDVDSAVIYIDPGKYDICFDPDDATDGASTAEVSIRKVIGPDYETNSSTVLSNASGVYVLTGAIGASCFYEVPSGVYWVEVVTPPSSETATVRIEKG